jgi:hypothetical protein
LLELAPVLAVEPVFKLPLALPEPLRLPLALALFEPLRVLEPEVDAVSEEELVPVPPNELLFVEPVP